MSFQFIPSGIRDSVFGVGRSAFSSLGGFRPCAGQRPALTVPNLMRFDFRKAFAWFAAASLIFWCSCERHHVGELPNEHATTETKATTEQHDAHSDQPAAMSPHSHTAQTPEPRNSPANFFPDKPKP